jgi:hypothetical protein
VDMVASAVMVLLSCSPDLMLCRAPAAGPTNFADLRQCEEALTQRLSAEKSGSGKTVGRCQDITEVGLALRWGVSPNGELFYAGPTDVTAIAPVSAAAPRKRETGPVTVRVTRGNVAGGTETTSYTVMGK